MEVTADLVVLATGIAPSRSAARVAEQLGVALTPDGFFQEADVKWQPVDATRDGIFLAGVAHSPQPVGDVLVQADAAAQRAFTLLSRPELATARDGARVRHPLCARCGQCVPACPYQARALDPAEARLVVDALACRACGLCAVACPNGASVVPAVDDRQVMAMLEATLSDLGTPRGAGGRP
jgi:heterodisulfide reductase subunit A